MKGLWFLRRPAHEAIPHHEVRYVAATKRENTKAARKQAETTAALNRIVTEQKLVAAVEAALRQSPMSIEARDA